MVAPPKLLTDEVDGVRAPAGEKAAGAGVMQRARVVVRCSRAERVDRRAGQLGISCTRGHAGEIGPTVVEYVS